MSKYRNLIRNLWTNTSGKTVRTHGLHCLPFCLHLLDTFLLIVKPHEPQHDKTNKMSVRPAKTQISLGIRPVWSESLLCAQWVAKDPKLSACRQRRLWSDWVDAQADLSLRWAHSHFVGFVMSRLTFSNLRITTAMFLVSRFHFYGPIFLSIFTSSFSDWISFVSQLLAWMRLLVWATLIKLAYICVHRGFNKVRCHNCA